MITDLILLIVLFALLFGIIKAVSLASPASQTKKPPSSASGTTFDWQSGEVKLKTNLRPVTQQELLERAEQTGGEGGRFMTDHKKSFHFGGKAE